MPSSQLVKLFQLTVNHTQLLYKLDHFLGGSCVLITLFPWQPLLTSPSCSAGPSCWPLSVLHVGQGTLGGLGDNCNGQILKRSVVKLYIVAFMFVFLMESVVVPKCRSL